MNLLKEVLAHEVYPALGCTEPITGAYCAAAAAAELGEPFTDLKLTVDQATFKNGACVLVPNTQGRTGNLIAAILGALIAKPSAKLQVLDAATPELVARAAEFRHTGRAAYACVRDRQGLWFEVVLTGANHTTRCVIADSHTNIQLIERDGQAVFQGSAAGTAVPALAYRDELRTLRLEDVIRSAARIDDQDRAYLRRGIQMNLEIARRGEPLRGTAFQLRLLRDKGLVQDDLFHRAKLLAASAVDARMGGLPYPVMTSGGSGNQGIIAILLPHLVALERNLCEDRMLKSLAVSHLVNAYVKCFIGELAAICGCALAAGIGAAAAIVYQHVGPDIGRITMAVNNVIGDLGGLICDGAKPGCALKVMTSVDSTLRSSFMAIEGYGLTEDQGVLGRTVEESIRHLARVSREGMTDLDPTVVRIITAKQNETPDGGN